MGRGIDREQNRDFKDCIGLVYIYFVAFYCEFRLDSYLFGSEKNFLKKTKRTGLVPEIIVNYHMSAMLQCIDRYML